MKRVFLILFAAVVVAASLFLFSPPHSGQTAQQSAPPAPAAEPTPAPTQEAAAETPVGWLDAYRPVIGSYRLFLAGEPIESGGETERGDYYLAMGETGVSYLARYGGTLGYELRDLNDDGLPELLVGAEGSEYYDGCLFDLFTLENGAPKRVLASSERVLYRLCVDGLIYQEGSGGASFLLRLLYAFDGEKLCLYGGAIRNGEEYYELREDRPDLSEMGANDVPLTEEAFYALTDSWAAMATAFPITPFA